VAASAARPAAPDHRLSLVSLWRDIDLFETLNHLLVMTDRERVEREASPSAAVLDSQSVQTTESSGPRTITVAATAVIIASWLSAGSGTEPLQANFFLL
jgi:hypothetical protein